LAYRIVQIYSEPESRDIVRTDAAIEKARKISICEAIKRVSRNRTNPADQS
jgi:hypothetical protein